MIRVTALFRAYPTRFDTQDRTERGRFLRDSDFRAKRKITRQVGVSVNRVHRAVVRSPTYSAPPSNPCPRPWAHLGIRVGIPFARFEMRAPPPRDPSHTPAHAVTAALPAFFRELTGERRWEREEDRQGRREWHYKARKNSDRRFRRTRTAQRPLA